MKDILKKFSVVGMVSVLIVGLTGCAGKERSWVAEYNGEKIPVGVYIWNVIESFNEFRNNDLMGKTTSPSDKDSVKIGQSENSKSGTSEDMSEKTKKTKKVSIYKKMMDGVPAEKWIEDKSKEEVINIIAINKRFKELGLNFSEEDKKSLGYVNNKWDELNEQSGYEKKGVSINSFQMVMETELKKQRLFEKYYDKGGLQEVSDESIRDYVNKNYNKVKYYSFDISGLSDEQKSENKKLYEEFLARTKMGESIEDLAKEFESRKKSEKADEKSKSADKESGIDEINTVSVYEKEDSREFTEEIRESIEKSEFNVVTGLDLKDQRIIFVREQPGNDESYIKENRDMLLKEYKGDEFEIEIKSWIKSSDVKFNPKAISYFTAKKLKLDDGQIKFN